MIKEYHHLHRGQKPTEWHRHTNPNDQRANHRVTVMRDERASIIITE